ncbi:MAG: hypothetical protein N3A57_02285 [Negativicutes bacterium]|nr:hypothetical protein [Negativicutes bacterium]
MTEKGCKYLRGIAAVLKSRLRPLAAVGRWPVATRWLLVAVLGLLLAAAAATAVIHRPSAGPSVAGLRPTGEDAGWGIADNCRISGDGLCRVVRGNDGRPPLLEMAAAGQSSVVFTRKLPADAGVAADWQFDYLSTQGDGQLIITASDGQGEVLAQLIGVFSGPLPELDSRQKLFDLRTGYNYVGGRMNGSYGLPGLFAATFPGFDPGVVAEYTLQLLVGNGQHVLVSHIGLSSQPWRQLVAEFLPLPATMDKGQTFTVQIAVTNRGRDLDRSLPVELVVPAGEGIQLLAPAVQMTGRLVGKETVIMSWPALAARADSQNGNKPWQLSVAVDGRPLVVSPGVGVVDRRPGEIYYLMTEDLEPIDGAGYPRAWGQQAGWLLPGEATVQLVDKAERLNAIAERYGGWWTHYLVVPFLSAARWAEQQSNGRGEWQQALAAVERSVREQSSRGHEYGLHLHIDYDPDLPGNTLSYNPANNGIWADHMRHGWAHSLGNLGGGFWQHDSKTGSLYDFLAELEQLTAAWPEGQQLTARVGSFDFGASTDSQQQSITAYRRVGLWGSSDAGGNLGQLTSADYGGELYLTAVDSINRPAGNDGQFGLVEFLPTPGQWISYDSDSVAAMNSKVDQGVAAFTEAGQVKPGIHAIVGFTHAIFMTGDGDWRSVDGGSFDRLDQHLAYVKTAYVDAGLVQFATAARLVKRKLAYSSPYPVAVRGRLLNETVYGRRDYAIEILGDDFLIDSLHPRSLTVKFPLHLRDTAWRVRVLKNGQTIADYWRLPTQFNDVAFVADDRQAEYRLQVFSWSHGAGLIKKLAGWWAGQ